MQGWQVCRRTRAWLTSSLTTAQHSPEICVPYLHQVAFEYNEFYGGHPQGYDPTATPVVTGVVVSNVIGTDNTQIADLVRW